MGEKIEKKGYPDRSEAEALLREAETLNPGLWSDHSRVAAKCAEAIAMACGDMDSEKAYVLGLLHDIGRRFSLKHLGHVYDGYIYMQELGYPQAARICLTHSFPTHRLTEYIGNFDIPPEQQQVIDHALSECVYDDYDRLIQLCDAISMADGAVAIEKRMGDVKRRYGHYPQEKWDKNIELKAYFSDKAKCDIEKLTGGITPSYQIRLVLAKPEDANLIHTMKYDSFLPLYNRYHDDETSPVNEAIDKVIAQLSNKDTHYYIIMLDSKPVGAMRVVNNGIENGEQIYRISPLFILPEYQNMGIGYRVLNMIFDQYRDADKWRLSTIKQEKGNCHLYEKCGFTLVGDETKVNDKMTLVYYERGKF